MNTYTNKIDTNKEAEFSRTPSQKLDSDGPSYYLTDNRPETNAQLKLQETIQKKENKTGLPEHLKNGIEHMSGYAMDDVKVHYNSSKPAQLNAHAYAQGTQIHLGPNQEKHLPHEAWHVVQQKQGRVKPTLQMKSTVNINDDTTLEKEADTMGNKLLNLKSSKHKSPHSNFKHVKQINTSTIQLLLKSEIDQLSPKTKAEVIATFGAYAGDIFTIAPSVEILESWLRGEAINIEFDIDELGSTTLLNYACKHNYIPLTIKLLELGADPNKEVKGYFKGAGYPLDIASTNQSTQICHLLIHHGANINETDALENAIESGEFDWVKFLIETLKAEVTEDSVETALKEKYLAIGDYLTLILKKQGHQKNVDEQLESLDSVSEGFDEEDHDEEDHNPEDALIELNRGNAMLLGIHLKHEIRSGNDDATDKESLLYKSIDAISKLKWLTAPKMSSQIVANILISLLEYPAVLKIIFNTMAKHKTEIAAAFIQFHVDKNHKGLKTRFDHYIHSSAPVLYKLINDDSKQFAYVDGAEGKTERKPKISSRWLTPAILKMLKQYQRRYSGNFALKKIKDHVGIDMKAATTTNIAFAESEFSGDPNERKLLLKKFYESAQTIPYYMQHSFDKPGIFDKITKEKGSVISQDKVEAVTGIKSEGLNTEVDRINQSHYFAYWGGGTQKEKLPSPEQFRSKSVAGFIIDIDKYLESDPGNASSLVFKGEDWGAQKQRTITIAEGITLTIDYIPGAPEKAKKAHSADSKIKYSYKDTTNGDQSTYEFNLADEVAVGKDFKKATASFIIRHLKHLPEKAQSIILGPLEKADTPLAIQKATSDIFQKFYYFEVSMGGGVPLKLDYVDSMMTEHKESNPSKKIDIKILREAIQIGNIEVVAHFLDQNKDIKEMPHLMEDALRLTTKALYTAFEEKKSVKNIQDILEVMLIFKRLVPKEKNTSVHEVLEEVNHVQMLQELILENESKLTYVTLINNRLIFKTSMDDKRRASGTHSAALPALAKALGSSFFNNKDTLTLDTKEIQEIETMTIVLDGNKAGELGSKTEHAGFKDVKAVRNALLSFELESLLVSAQNHLHFARSEKHPLTGPGASESSILTKTNRLGYQVSVSTNAENQVLINVGEASKTPEVQEAIASTLKIDNFKAEGEKQFSIIGITVGNLIARMKKVKTNYQGVVPFDEEGNILLAERYGETRGSMGLASSGGHSSDNYHPYTGALVELEEENALKAIPKEIHPESQTIARVGPYRDTIVIALPRKSYTPTEAAILHKKAYELHHDASGKKLTTPFKAEEEEFKKFSEEILSHNQMRGRKFRNIMPLPQIVIWEEKQLNSVLVKYALKASIDKSVKLETIVNEKGKAIEFQIPGESFGQIEIKPIEGDVIAPKIEPILGDIKKSEANIAMEEDKLILNNINPLKLLYILNEE